MRTRVELGRELAIRLEGATVIAATTKLFRDREDAARKLGEALSRYRGCKPLILAIPRGGVPIGRVLVDALGGDLDVVLVRKLRAPDEPEVAVGAIDETGTISLNAHADSVDTAYLGREAELQLDVLRQRRARYGAHRAPFDPAGRTVIVVDDGLATGSTMRAALCAVRARNPARLVCAVPVGAPSSLRRVHRLADDVECLATPEHFGAVGQYYDRFPSVDEANVIALLSSAREGIRVGFPVMRSVGIDADGVHLSGDLHVPVEARGLVIFVHGSASSRKSPRNRMVADELNRVGFATLLLDLLTEREDQDVGTRFDIDRLARRLCTAVEWATRDPIVFRLPIGLFGASTGAAAALVVAAARPDTVRTIVCRGGRPDLVPDALLKRVRVPTLLVVGGADPTILTINRSAGGAIGGTVELVVIPGATHLFEQPGALAKVSHLATEWFSSWLPVNATRAARGADSSSTGRLEPRLGGNV